MAERKPIISFRNFSFQYRAQKRPTLTGIDLDIYMYAQPQIHLTDFKAETPLDGDYRNGILKLKVKFANETGKETPFLVSYRLLDSKDKLIAQSSTRVSLHACH